MMVCLTKKQKNISTNYTKPEWRLFQWHILVFLGFTNGIQTDTLSLFGIGKPNSFVHDIFEINSVSGAINEDEIFLGDNSEEYLFYNWTMKSFVIVNKADKGKTKLFPFWDQALEYFLREYISETAAGKINKLRKKAQT